MTDRSQRGAQIYLYKIGTIPLPLHIIVAIFTMCIADVEIDLKLMTLEITLCQIQFIMLEWSSDIITMLLYKMEKC